MRELDGASFEERNVARPHPCNAPGDFYVEDGCCITCGVIHDIAPDMFDWTAEEDHCFVKAQPAGPDDLDRMVHALWSAEASCIRYGGSDAALLRRIAESGLAECCDEDPGLAPLLIRDLASFESSLGAADTAREAADRFRAWLERPRAGPGYSIRPPRLWRPATVIFSWDIAVLPRGHWHRVSFAEDATEPGAMEARLRSQGPGTQGLALMVDEWLKEVDGATGVRWFSPEERAAGAAGFHMPI